MARTKVEKYIDMSQFITNGSKIKWKENINRKISFSYCNETHYFEIIELVAKDYVKIIIDNSIVVDKIHTSMIKNVCFGKYLYRPSYKFNSGEIVGNIKILSRIQMRKTNLQNIDHIKGYMVKCLIDNYEFQISEYDILKGHGCPVCSNNKIIEGINNVGFTDPDIVDFLVNKNDAKKYARKSLTKVLVECPYCHHTKYMSISELTKNKRVTCDICSDGFSYPNKFAHELFNQLFDQYILYENEYSPDWGDRYRYDNYVELLSGEKVIFEFDGGYHCLDTVAANDKEKDDLASKHGITIVRIDCNYPKITQRFEFIKKNVIYALKKYFDLSNVDWNKCNKYGTSNNIIDVGLYYKNNPKCNITDIMNHFHILSSPHL